MENRAVLYSVENEIATITLNHEAVLQPLCMQTADHQEGLSAFKEKRLPNFTVKSPSIIIAYTIKN